MFFTGPIRHGSMAANCGVFATGGTMVLLTHDGPIFLFFWRCGVFATGGTMVVLTHDGPIFLFFGGQVSECDFTLWTLLMGDRERVEAESLWKCRGGCLCK
jgi:hypothetical protein